MKKFLNGIIVFLALINISGCAPLFLVAVGGVGVYAVSKDTVQGDTDTPYESLWDAAIKVSKIRGAIRAEDFNKGTIQLDAASNKVWIRFERLTMATTRMKVSARRFHLPNRDVAQELFIKILEEAKNSN